MAEFCSFLLPSSHIDHLRTSLSFGLRGDAWDLQREGPWRAELKRCQRCVIGVEGTQQVPSSPRQQGVLGPTPGDCSLSLVRVSSAEGEYQLLGKGSGREVTNSFLEVLEGTGIFGGLGGTGKADLSVFSRQNWDFKIEGTEMVFLGEGGRLSLVLAEELYNGAGLRVSFPLGLCVSRGVGASSFLDLVLEPWMRASVSELARSAVPDEPVGEKVQRDPLSAFLGRYIDCVTAAVGSEMADPLLIQSQQARLVSDSLVLQPERQCLLAYPSSSTTPSEALFNRGPPPLCRHSRALRMDHEAMRKLLTEQKERVFQAKRASQAHLQRQQTYPTMQSHPYQQQGGPRLS